jgi:hypothetical protein
MGKKAKEHRKKVAARNERIKQKEKTIQRLWEEALEEQLKKVKEKGSDKTEVEEVQNTIDVDTINNKIDSLQESVNLLENESEEIDFQSLIEKINDIKNEFPNIDDNLSNENETEKNTESTEPISGNETI